MTTAMRRTFRTFRQPVENYGDRNARLAGEGWSGHAAKRSPRKASDYDGQLARRLAEQFRRLNAKLKDK